PEVLEPATAPAADPSLLALGHLHAFALALLRARAHADDLLLTVGFAAARLDGAGVLRRGRAGVLRLVRRRAEVLLHALALALLDAGALAGHLLLSVGVAAALLLRAPGGGRTAVGLAGVRRRGRLGRGLLRGRCRGRIVR